MRGVPARMMAATVATATTVLLLGSCDAESTVADPPVETGDSEVPDGTGESPPGSDPGTEPDPESGSTLPGLPTPDEARDQLAALTVADPRPMTGYSRDEFPHWAEVDGCTVRQLVLQRDGENVEVDDGCQPESGTWFSPYEEQEYTDPADIDIDHMVPLANAWRSGADAWTEDEREAFANDLDHPQLLAVNDRVNSDKGDQSPDEWLPPAEAFHCTYALAWTSVKHTYELTVTEAERDQLGALLDTCA
ncbi:HNH endonuclease family protein [Streptomyces specialis]|uniref:HNH endonuclease family protein n=1 Tax=Streptomyces specialis TaxID=498367 RepID=UPI00099EF5AA|nr:HNH endonuclease family protein [Streptomyces specialis]